MLAFDLKLQTGSLGAHLGWLEMGLEIQWVVPVINPDESWVGMLPFLNLPPKGTTRACILLVHAGDR